MTSIRRGVEARLAELIRRDPERAADAIEVGLIDREWLESPVDKPIRTVGTAEVLQRYIEKSVEEQPSVLQSLGLNAVQFLAWPLTRSSGRADPMTVAVVFTDLENFTRFTNDFGDAAAVELLAEHHRAVSPIVRGRGGRIVKRLGDGLMLAFPQPEAALKAALELVPTSPEPLCLRAGVHVGEAVVSRDDVVGHVVNVAARVTELAKGGEVLTTEATRDAVGDLPGVAFGRRRKVRFKGVPEPMAVCKVAATPPT